MTKKNKKNLRRESCLFVVFCFVLFFLPTFSAFAAGLEVQYPDIYGTSLAATGTGTSTTLPSLPDYVFYLFKAGVFIGFFAVFISLSIGGAYYFLSPINAEAKSNAKERISGAISGLLILSLTYLIITTINPQLAVLNITPLPPTPPTPVSIEAPGVYFYKNASECPYNANNSAQPYTSSLATLGSMKNVTNAIGIVQGTDRKYIAIIYDAPSFRGMCQYLNPNQPCSFGTRFAASASIYGYDSNPNGEGVYFYHKSYFSSKNPMSGGYLKISNNTIKPSGGSFYTVALKDLHFTGNGGGCNVPEEEQDCTKYDDDGACTQRSCPALSGENISSVEIKGDYLVLFVYFAPTDNTNGPWTSCQEFPTPTDVNNSGPQQIKWEKIRNNKGVVPNYIIIIPIKR